MVRGSFEGEKMVGRGGFFGWAMGFLWALKRRTKIFGQDQI